MGWSAWQPWVIGGLAVLVMLHYVMRALFADRAKGRPRCLRCGHPFVEEQGLTCTECGWTARRPADLLRTRRHWGKAATALLILLGSAVGIRLVALGGNPLMLLPSRVLVVLLPIDPPGFRGIGPMAVELRRRLVGEGLSEATTVALVERVVSGDSGTVPGSDGWVDRYGMLADDLRSRHGSPSDPLAAQFLRIPPRIELATPDGWPSTEPIPATLAIRDWWPMGTEAIITLGDTDAGDAWHEVGFRNHGSIQRRHHLLLPPGASWPAGDEIDVTIRLRRVDLERTVLDASPSLESWRSMPEVTTIRARTPVDRPDDRPAPALEPWAGDAEVDVDVAAVFDRGLRRWPGTSRPYAIRFNPRRLARDDYEGVHFGLVVDIVERRPDGTESIHRRTRMWMPGGTSRSSRGRSSGWTISEEDTAGLAGAFDPSNDSTWLLRVRGDESLAILSALSSDVEGDKVELSDPSPEEPSRRWWSGSLERPLPVETAEGRPFIRMWFHPEGVRPPAAASPPAS